MKIERMFALLLYLLSHKRVTKSALANYFEVSSKTIQRDIEALTAVGIPIETYLGVSGGYAIKADFKMKNQIADFGDYQSISTALKALNSALPEPLSKDTLTKIQSLYNASNTHLALDFSVLKENEKMMGYYQFLDDAISKERVISFSYRNAKQIESMKTVDPIGLVYKWYTWYLVGYDRHKKSYRCYKLARMKALKSENGFINEHPSLETILSAYLNKDDRVYYDILLLCKAETNLEQMDCLNGVKETVYPNGDFLFSMHLPKDEMMWKGALILLGSQIQVLEPLELKKELIDLSQNFIHHHQ